MEIRELRAGDAKGLSLLICSVSSELPEAMNFPEMLDDSAALAVIETKLDSARRGALIDIIAIEEGEVIADCEMLRRGGEGVLGIIVATRHRRRGIGSGLIERCIEEARRVGIREAVAEVEMSNAPAITFFRKLGFKDAGSAPGKEGAVLMRRSLL